jgi:hypothetical protein
MTSLPSSTSLSIESLAACFQKTTNSYKFYWFISILEHIKKNRTAVIPIDELKITMVASIWYPAVYFKLSFGKQDRLSITAMMLKDTAEKDVINRIAELRKIDHEFVQEFNQLDRYVCYRFLEPFFRDALRGVPDHQKNGLIATLAQESFLTSNSPSIYKFQSKKTIDIHPAWYSYIEQHLPILQEYCYWNLLKFLQLRNPNVPNIAGKLFLPRTRDLDNARAYWQHALHKLDECRCIYSQGIIPLRSFSLDHFLPWRYVTHDLIWNIIPTLPAVNSSKGDRLPNLAMYFERFAHMQFNALQIVATSTHIKQQLLEDYILLFGCEHRNDLNSIHYDTFYNKLYETIAPQFQVARSMGFIGNWSYFPHDLSIATKP